MKNPKKIVIFIAIPLFLLGIFFSIDKQSSSEVSLGTDPLFVDLTWEGLVNSDSKSIVIGHIIGDDVRKNVVKISDPDDSSERYLHANVYTIAIQQKIKGMVNEEKVQVQILEEDNSGLKIGDEVVLFLTGEQVIVPVAGHYGIFKVENGKVFGDFLYTDESEQTLTPFIENIQMALNN
jgi:uncharacterized protein YacL (UPF0231 family)